MKVAPAMVRVPDRLMPVLLRATAYFTVEVPVKLLPVRVTHVTLLFAVQAHPLDEAVVFTLPLPPVFVKFLEVGERVNLQTGAVNVAVTDLAAVILPMLQFIWLAVPVTLSQAPAATGQLTVEPLLAVAVSLTAVP